MAERSGRNRFGRRLLKHHWAAAGGCWGLWCTGQGQLAGLSLRRVAVASTVDTGDWVCVHPSDKQTPSLRLATAALDQVYGMKSYEDAHSPPLYAGQALLHSPTFQVKDTATPTPSLGRGAGAVVPPMVRVRVRLSRPATTTVPPWVTASYPAYPGSIPRNAWSVTAVVAAK